MQNILHKFIYQFVAFSLIFISCSQTSDVNIPTVDAQEQISICNQIITKMNLNVEQYRDGSIIRHAQTDAEWYDAAIKGEGAWCYYNNNPQHGQLYGKLYNWYAVNNTKGLAPNGWKIPSEAEFDIVYDCSDFLEHFGSMTGGSRYGNGSFMNLGSIGTWWTSTEDPDGRVQAKGIMGRSIRINYTEMKERGFSVICIKQ